MKATANKIIELRSEDFNTGAFNHSTTTAHAHAGVKSLNKVCCHKLGACLHCAYKIFYASTSKVSTLYKTALTSIAA